MSDYEHQPYSDGEPAPPLDPLGLGVVSVHVGWNTSGPLVVWVAVNGPTGYGDDRCEVAGVYASKAAAEAAHPYATIESWEVEL